MRTSPSLTLIPLLLLSACPGISDDKGGDLGDYNGSGIPNPGEGEGEGEGEGDSGFDTGGEGEGEGEGEGDREPLFLTSWSGSGVTLTIRDGSGPYNFGMVETDPVAEDPWTGEDCIYGYTTSSGTYYQFCHPMSETGGSLPTVTSFSSMSSEGTLFSRSLEDVITYVAFDEYYNCWTWGADTSYYTTFGCTVQR